MLANNDRNDERGNMRQVWLEIAKSAEASIQRADERQGPFAAEIVPGCKPNWYAVLIAPSHELITAAHLAARRFGVYVPQFDEKEFVRGHARVRRANLLPGYDFVFVWDIERHWGRIRACPGVTGLLRTVDGDPAVVPDDFIDRMQVIECASFASLMKPKRGRPGWRRRRQCDEADVVTISTRSYLDGIETLAASERISLFRQALGLG